MGLQDSLRAVEQKMTSCFTKIEQRLDSLEERMITQSELVSKTSLLQVFNELELGYTFQKLGGHFLTTNKEKRAYHRIVANLKNFSFSFKILTLNWLTITKQLIISYLFLF